MAELVDERVVDDDDRITAGALFCSVDLGLWVIERELGTQAADRAAAGKAYLRQGRVGGPAATAEKQPVTLGFAAPLPAGTLQALSDAVWGSAP